MKLPAYGQKILNARLEGNQPSQMVVVTDNWKIGRIYPRIVVKLHELEQYDFRFLHNLDLFVHHDSTNAERMALLIDKLFEIKPHWLAVMSSKNESLQILKPAYANHS